jgi:ribosomal-protein-alanine N-acetyltransferase
MWRAPIASDRQDRLSYGRDPEFRRMVGGDPSSCPPLTKQEVDGWYRRLCAEPLHWVIEAEGHCIGAARLHALDEPGLCARYAIGIFSPGYWGRGYGAEATRLVLGFAFEVLRLGRVDLHVLAFNRRAIACYRKCGFVEEAGEPERVLIGGEWHSDVLMSISEHQYREQAT